MLLWEVYKFLPNLFAYGNWCDKISPFILPFSGSEETEPPFSHSSPLYFNLILISLNVKFLIFNRHENHIIKEKVSFPYQFRKTSLQIPRTKMCINIKRSGDRPMSQELLNLVEVSPILIEMTCC